MIAGTGADVPSRWPEASRLADGIVGASGGSIRLVMLYGSHLHNTSPDRHSAVDLVVVVDGYRAFYSALHRAGQLHRPVGLVTVLASVLAPNVLAYAPDEGRGGLAKYLVLTRRDFERALSASPPDHFLLARMVQRVGVVWRRNEEEEAWLVAQLEGARARVLDWMAPYLSEPVDAEGLGRRILEVCYQSELRPESTARSGRVFEAQAEHFRTTLSPVLEEAVAGGVMRLESGRYALAHPASSRSRRRWRWHFRRSKARTTARWFKHIATFANWLPYVVRKVERHQGRRVELTTLERRLPLIFLWPKVFRVLVTRPQREIEP